MTPISEANLLCVMISDAPEVTAKIKGLLRENELLRARITELEADRSGAGDAASLALQQANAYTNSLLNRH